MSESENLKFLTEMGFSEEKSKRALQINNNNYQEAVEWLIAHSGDAEPQVQPPSSSGTLKLSTAAAEQKQQEQEKTESETKEETEGSSAEGLTANSLKCDDCGALLRDEDFATLHAHKTGHVNFSQSTESIKPKTPEEIEEQKKRLQEKIARLRQEKSEKEKAEQIEQEKARRKQGRQLNEIKQKMHEDELKRIAEEKRREKLADIAYKQKLKEQIAKDREDKKKEANPQVEQTKVNPTVSASTVQPQEKKDYSECRIQIRLTDGKSIVQTFKATEQLAAVRLWIEMNRTDGTGKFNLMQTFPRKIYDEDDMMRTLKDLGLVPASSLVITKI